MSGHSEIEEYYPEPKPETGESDGANVNNVSSNSAQLEKKTSKTSIFDNVSKKSNTKKHKVKSFWKKLSLDFSLMLYKLRTVANEVLSSDEALDDMFQSRSKSTSISSQEQISSNEHPHSQTQDTNIDMQQLIRSSDSDLLNEISYNDLDVTRLREELVKDNPDEPFLDGEMLYELRRHKWLDMTEEQAVAASKRKIDNNINHIPREYYETLYKKMIDESHGLRKPMNLRDAIKIINAGWVANQKWERAAQGLP